MSQDKELVTKILDSINELISLDKKRIVTFEDQKLYPSELQLLMILYEVEETNVTAIGGDLGLTKGAISQTLSRLEKKGIIRKENIPGTKLQIHFTESGNELMNQLKKKRRSIQGKFRRYIKTLTPEEKQLLSEFLDKMVSIMDHS